MSPWHWLLLAGAVEVAWSQSIKPTDGFTRILPTIVCFVLGATSVYLLSRAMRDLPVGLSYVVFTGMGAVGAVVLGAVLAGDRLTTARVVGTALVVTGVLVCRASDGGAA